MKADFHVEGMDCAEEVAGVRAQLDRLEGVRSSEFDLLEGRLRVDYDPDLTGPEAIIQAVRRAGLRAVPWQQRARPHGWWRRHGQAVVTAVGAALAVGGFGAHWATCGSLLDALGLAEGAGSCGGYPPVSVALYGTAIMVAGAGVFARAVRAARSLRADMNLLMTVAVLGAVAIGQWFEAAAVTVLFSLALALEHWSVERARRAVSALLELAPQTAEVLAGEGAEPASTPVEQVPVGAVVRVRPHQRVPLDGVVLRGESHVDQSPVTGESMPVHKRKGDAVFAGTINGDGTLEVEVTRPATDSTLARIIRMVREAQSRRAPAEQWVERFARVYTPAMMALAAAVGLGRAAVGAPAAQALYSALVLLVIACPCALVISTPVTIVAGLAAAARRGALIKGGRYLEELGRLRAIALDKTGTLTHGRPTVTEVVPLDGHSRRELLERAAAVEADSTHPLARAIVHAAVTEGIVPKRGREFIALKGRGAEATVDGRRCWIGSHRLLEERGAETPELHQRALELERAGRSVVVVGTENNVCGLIAIADQPRPMAAEALRRLKAAGLAQTLMLTGDNRATAEVLANTVGVDRWEAELLPEEKVAAVERLREAFGKVAMVGDGVNDAPAMAAASLGIAMGVAGTDAAIETADVALMNDDLMLLPWLVEHSRRTLRIVRANVAFSLAVKAAFVLLASLGMATLWTAIAADMGASLLVTFNGLRLLAGGSPRGRTGEREVD